MAVRGNRWGRFLHNILHSDSGPAFSTIISVVLGKNDLLIMMSLLSHLLNANLNILLPAILWSLNNIITELLTECFLCVRHGATRCA